MTLKKILFLLLSGYIQAGAQNLIPNGSFENNTVCPNNNSQINLATPWMNPSTTGSPDYYHQCGSYPASVPLNNTGYQQPMQGLGYSGMYLYSILSGSDLREYIEAPLTTTLQAGFCYKFKMYVSLCSNYRLTTDDIGAYFSPTLISVGLNYNALPYTPQVSNTQGVFLDTLNWTLVSGSFVASGNEQYVIIGNFKNGTKLILLRC
jgi:OOP family OmpA-OmpF porin